MNQNYYSNNYGYNSYPVNPGYQVQPTTNKIYVTSLEDAIQRYASPNSTMIYVLQDESAIFEIYTDMQGKKLSKVRKLVEFAPEDKNGAFVSREEFNELKNKVDAMGVTKEVTV